MDNGMQKSKLLDYIFQVADDIRLKGKATSVNVNILFAAVLEKFEKLESISAAEGFDAEEVARLRKLFENICASEDRASSVNKLCEAPTSFMDTILLSRTIRESSIVCVSKGLHTLNADIFFKCIIDSPTAAIGNVIDKKKPEGRISFDSMFQAEQEAEPEEEQKPAEEEKIESPEETKAYIAELTEKVKNMQKELSNIVFGQDNAINTFASGYFQAELRRIVDKGIKSPRATFLFAGPPGVGKTFLAEQGAEMLGLPFKRFDMSEFSENTSTMELTGSNKTFRDSKQGSLTSFVKKNKKCVLLFDEIEKAHINIIHLFLQVLDAGRLRDTYSDEDVDFSQTVLIFTTNAGRKIYEGAAGPNLSGISRKTILKELERDVDPKTGRGVFPAAICSRFATGNVVMFNHMEAHVLRKIAAKQLGKNIKSFEEETGIKCTVADDVYSCILFAEGGNADARTVRSRANAFFSTELYELLRLVSKNHNSEKLKEIKSIDITLELPEEGKVRCLFKDEMKGCILSFGAKELCSRLDNVAAEKGYSHIIAETIEEAKDIIRTRDVEMVFCDLHYCKHDDADELNIEDVDSDGREFFRYVCESSDAPLYVIADAKHCYSDEEQFSLFGEGARGVIYTDDEEALNASVKGIMTQLHQQQSMIDLAKSNKAVIYETAQTISEDGTRAEIRLFDMKLETLVDADDSEGMVTDVSKPNIRFDDIIGADKAKEELQYFINYLKNPKAYSSKGLGVPKGVLFYGPPGTGKTLLAKAVAGESDVTFISAEGNQFLQKYVGVGKDLVHELFAKARKYAPSIIFIDEIDTIGKERTGSEFTHANEDVLTAFLAEMDGFKTDAKKPVFVLAATNYGVEPGSGKVIDSALLRRFDRHILIDLPDKNARIKYIKKQISRKRVFEISEEEIENIAVRSTGMSLANLASVFEFAMRIAIRENKDKIDDAVFEEAFETISYGEEKKWDKSELRQTAFHEAGHAFLCWHSGETPSYLTIVARGNHGGYMMHGDTEGRGSYTKAMLLNRIRTALGGRASELVFYGADAGLTTGASGDLSNATSVARSMICNYGMDDELGLAVVTQAELADGAMAQKVRDSINKVLTAELENAKTILEENRAAVEKIVEALLEKNQLVGPEIDRIFSEYAVTRAEK